MATPTDAALLQEIPARLAAAVAAAKAARSIGAKTKALASEQAWNKVQQSADRVITRGREEYRSMLDEKLAFARKIDATPENDPSFTN